MMCACRYDNKEVFTLAQNMPAGIEIGRYVAEVRY